MNLPNLPAGTPWLFAQFARGDSYVGGLETSEGISPWQVFEAVRRLGTPYPDGGTLEEFFETVIDAPFETLPSVPDGHVWLLIAFAGKLSLRLFIMDEGLSWAQRNVCVEWWKGQTRAKLMQLFTPRPAPPPSRVVAPRLFVPGGNGR